LAIAELGSLFFWVALLVLALMVVAAVWAFARGARRADLSEPGPFVPSEATERHLTRAVGASTLVAVLLLALLLVTSVATGRNLADFAPPKPLRVKVTAHQWWWQIEYPGDKPDDTAVTANELHVPAGRPIELELKSVDVIHSFWLPNLDGKHDLIPSRVVKTIIQADDLGTYSGRCAEFCGYQHAHMDLVLVAETPTDFEAWLATQRQHAVEPATPTTQHGKELVEQGPCALCHSISGTRARGGVGPDLSHFASHRTLAAGAAPLSSASLHDWLKDPQQLKPGTQMPAIALSPGDLDAMTAYLETLR